MKNENKNQFVECRLRHTVGIQSLRNRTDNAKQRKHCRATITNDLRQNSSSKRKPPLQIFAIEPQGFSGILRWTVNVIGMTVRRWGRQIKNSIKTTPLNKELFTMPWMSTGMYRLPWCLQEFSWSLNWPKWPDYALLSFVARLFYCVTSMAHQ